MVFPKPHRTDQRFVDRFRKEQVLKLRIKEAAEFNPTQPIEGEDLMLLNYHVDLAEEGREGDDLSGDEHSSGLQGEENEFSTLDGGQFFHDEGLPGDEEKNQEEIVDFEQKRAAS